MPSLPSKSTPTFEESLVRMIMGLKPGEEIIVQRTGDEYRVTHKRGVRLTDFHPAFQRQPPFTEPMDDDDA